jgi:prevent-host-death family protein
MQIASLAEVKAHFSAYVKASAQGLVVITRNGKPAAVLLAVSEEDELERLLMAHSRQLQALSQAAHQRIQSGKGVPAEEFWQEVERDQTRKRRNGKGNRRG